LKGTAEGGTAGAPKRNVTDWGNQNLVECRLSRIRERVGGEILQSILFGVLETT
jgi:hypothetical protein